MKPYTLVRVSSSNGSGAKCISSNRTDEFQQFEEERVIERPFQPVPVRGGEEQMLRGPHHQVVGRHSGQGVEIYGLVGEHVAFFWRPWNGTVPKS
jgi:hypothetical protein